MTERASFVGTLIWNSASEFFEPLISLLRAPVVRRAVRTIVLNIHLTIPLISLIYTLGNLTLHKPEMVYRTDVGELKQVRLPAGTSVALNTDALLRVQSSSDGMTMQLVKGEALFTVRPQSSLPLLVRAGNAEVRTAGAVFAVRLQSSGSVNILVSEGNVELESPVRRLLRAGDIAETSASSDRIGLLPESDLRRKLSWEKGYLKFDGATLSEAVADLNRYNKLRIVIDDPSVAKTRIGGEFRATDTEAFCGFLRAALGIRINRVETESGTEIHLSGPSS